MIKKLLFLVLLSGSLVLAQDGRLIPSPLRKIPKWVRNEYAARNLDRQYTITFARHPAYLKGDFNGDGRKDIAIQIQEKISAKEGIVIFHAKKAQRIATPITVLGAGKSLGTAGDDFQKMDMWELMKRRDVQGTSDMLIRDGDAIKMAKRDSTGGYIYWTGKQYTWKKESTKGNPK